MKSFWLPDRSFHLQPVSFAYFHYTISFSLSNIRYFVASFWVVPSRLSWSRNYAAKDIELKKSPKVKDCSVIEESFLTGFLQQVKNPKCEPDEYGIKYLPVMHQAMCIEGRKVLEAGVDAMDLKDEIYMAFEAIKGHLKCRARVGRTAANEDKRIDVLLT
ncbi:hypothetical protein CUMW_109990 [Citrus unshiu]|nr:hypothetical protein CUMW_109990 [Citrus unshiu]